MRSVTSLATLIFICGVVCSAAPQGGRVVGGDYAEPGQFPHQIYLKKYGSFSCGGSIYSENYVITAAHCVVSYGSIPSPSYAFEVVAGTNSRVKGGVFKKIKNVIVHKDYDFPKNDIALLELEEPFNFGDKSKPIAPIELHEGGDISGYDVIISGWGRTSTNGPTPNDLKYNNLTLITQPECGKQINEHHPGLTCIAHEPNNGVCFGDSGGPAVVEGKLVGVASFVIRSCGTSEPDGYTYVPYFVEWIKENTVQQE